MADKVRGRGRARGQVRDSGPPPGLSPAGGLQQQQVPMLGSGRAANRGASAEYPGQEPTCSSESEFESDEHIWRATVRHKRPIKGVATKLGTYGTPVKLSANYFKILQQPNWNLYQYRVDIAPHEDVTSIKKALFKTAMHGILTGYIFDGTVLYTSNTLNPDPLQVSVKNERTNQNFRFTIRLVGNVALGDYKLIQFLNIIIRKCFGHLHLNLVGRNFFDAMAKVSIPEHHMQLWPGYITSIRQHENAILMCVEMTYKVMRRDTVLHLLSDCVREDQANYKRIFQSRIIGSIVLTGYNNRTYCIDDVDFKSTPSSTFSKRDGTTISYAQYFRDRYNLQVSSMDQPMLISRAKTREIRAGMAEQVYLVPELCCMTGLTDAQRANFQLMRSLADHTRMAPLSRIKKLVQFSQRLNNEPRVVQELQDWDLKLSQTLIQFQGRVLPPEEIFVGNGKSFSARRDADWTRNLPNNSMLHTIPLNQWVVVCPSKLLSNAISFLKRIIKAGEGMHWHLPFPKLQEIPDDARVATYIEGIETALNNFKPQLLVCIVTNNKSDRYSAIKKKCYVDLAIPNQVILSRNLNAKNAMSIATKIAIQMNCKVGGAPWCIPLPYNNMMVVGFDVCHDSSYKQRSYGALVASLNKECTSFYSTVTPHTNGEEMSNDLALGVIKSARIFQQQCGVLPEKIVIYRDGVGNGQLAYVNEYEVQNVRQKLLELYGSKYKLCFILTSKRINTRIFTSQGENPVPGTVVDDVITLPERCDFFLISQCVRQGTATPTSYTVLYDNMGQGTDKLQRLTNKLTHMYFNWSGSVRVPAPCQYAHKLAFLVGQHLHRNPHSDLANSLYYL